MKKYTKIICMIAAVCLLGAAAFCGFRIYSHYAHESKQEEVFGKRRDCHNDNSGNVQIELTCFGRKTQKCISLNAIRALAATSL